METWKEGLKEYRIIQGVENSYFLDVEYHILHCNRIPELLSVQIRDQDGACRLLYEISGMKCMKALNERQVLTLQQYRIFLEDCRDLVGVLDKYMLDIRQISFDPGDIYQGQNGHVRWIYSPEAQNDVSGNIVKLFEWMLSMIDYGDMKTVQFAYHAYWCIRNHTFSEKVLRDCLDYEGEEIAKYTSGSYDDYFKSTSSHEDSKKSADSEDLTYSCFSDSSGFLNHSVISDHDRIPDPSGMRTGYKREGTAGYADDEESRGDHEQRGRLFFAVEIFCIIVEVIIAALLVAFLLIGIFQNMMREMKYIYLSLTTVLLIIGDCTWQLHKNRKLLSEKENHHVIFHKEMLQPSYNYSWEQEGGTEVLGIRRDMLQPALKDKDNGTICPIKDFPFFIGSNPEINNLVIQDAAISRRHAVIVRGLQTGYYDLQDLRSTNGTWLNQTALVYEKPVRLKPGDNIRLASKQLEFIMLDYPMGEYHESQEQH